jgi:quinol monooxygenase YgiN
MLSNVKNDDLQVLFGIWESKEALEDHIRSNDFKKIMAIMEMSDETPEIRFSKVSDIGGVDLIEKLRGE